MMYKKMGRPSKRPSDSILFELYEVYSAQQIANEFSVSVSTVNNWLVQARKRVKSNV